MREEIDRYACPACGLTSTMEQLVACGEMNEDGTSFEFYCPRCESWYSFPGSAQDWKHVTRGQAGAIYRE